MFLMGLVGTLVHAGDLLTSLWATYCYSERSKDGCPVSVNDFIHSFTKKMGDIRSSTESTGHPVLSLCPDKCLLDGFKPLLPEDTASIIGHASNKASSFDSIPTWLVNECTDYYAHSYLHFSIDASQKAYFSVHLRGLL